MQKRVAHIIILVLLLATALSGVFLFTLDTRLNQITASEQDVNARLFRIGNTIAAIGQSEQSYIAPGQSDGPWLARTATLAAQLSDDLKNLRARVHSAQGLQAVDALAMSCDALVDADNRIRQNLRLGQTLMAADVLFSDSRNILDVTTTHIADVRDAQQAAYGQDRLTLTRERWMVFGATGLAWLTLALTLVVLSSRNTSPAAQPLATDTAPTTSAAVAPIDLTPVAELCTDLSRVATTAALPSLLKRAASLLDASGAILWMSAGEQLFAVTGHGYDPQVIPRFGPVSRDADNAAAEAWRTGRIVALAADGTAPGALVAPMFGTQGCFGVIAFELRASAPPNPSIEPIATLIAAQLATAVAAWPAASQTQPVLELTLDEPETVRRPA